jgi:hypothetical protein
MSGFPSGWARPQSLRSRASDEGEGCGLSRCIAGMRVGSGSRAAGVISMGDKPERVSLQARRFVGKII